MQAKELYDKIRWIDETGRERLRVEHLNAQVAVVPSEKLQYKGNRYFFQEAIRLKLGQIYVSPLDLNVEEGEIEVPYRPTIRFATPLFGSDGLQRGILLANYSAERLLQRFALYYPNRSDGVWLLNQDGYWIKGDYKELEFGFMLGRPDLTVAQKYPLAWERIAAEDSGQFEAEEGLWTFATIRPLDLIEGVSTAGSMSIQAVDGLQGREYHWKAVHLLPARDYNANLDETHRKVWFLSLLLIVLFFAGAWRLVRLHFDETEARMGLERTVDERTSSLKAAVGELYEQQSRLRSLIMTIPDMMWLKSPEGIYLECNHNFERLFGVAKSEIIGRTDYDFVDNDLADFFRANDLAAIKAGAPHTNEEWVTVAESGCRVLLETTKVPVSTADGRLIGVLGIGRDVTQQRRLESRLREQEQLLRLFVENAPAAISMFDRDMRFLAVSRRFLENFNVAEKDLIGRVTYDVFPDAPKRWRKAHQRGLAGESVRMEEDNFVRADGRVEWTRWEIKPWYAGGKVGGIILFTEVITQRKEAEEDLKMAAMVYRDSSEAMMIADADSKIVAVNPAFERITGYLADEVLGRSTDTFSSGLHDDEVYQAIVQELNRTGQWKGELWNRRKNGELFAALLAINTTYNPDGQVHRRVTLFSDITKKKQSEDMIWNQANFDALTNLPNRNLFRDHLKQAIKKSRRTSLPMALMFLDLDGFKYVNDTLGHDMGDLLLQEAARRLNACIRESDTVARMGGDEFTVILTELHDAGNVSRVARHILERLSEPFHLREEVAQVSASIGITLYPNDATAIEDLLKNADQAMYAAKHEGRNRFRYFTQAMQEATQARTHMVNDMRGALGGEQFEVAYQPIVDLVSGQVCKAEALLRWRHPTKGFISPTDFIALAEDTGMIGGFGDWIFRRASTQAVEWRRKRPDFQMNVNISPIQFRNGNLSLTLWSEHLRDIGLPGSGLVVEITENLLLDPGQKVKDQLLAFRDAGIEVALDDFGVGYSSLSYLKRFDIHYIKIDRVFVGNLTEKSDDLALCEAMIAMAHKLGIRVIAEGVETQQQRDILVATGCDFAQGFLFSGPVSAADFERFLENGSFESAGGMV